jgi:hypothetical protein
LTLNAVSFNRNVEHLKMLKTRLTHEEVENASITVFFRVDGFLGALEVNKESGGEDTGRRGRKRVFWK